ncbi:transporter [Hymenobacter sp. BT188]|uniref:transporter n=1 Tax=Hymenobacter sp. BT188 TaxID=2763504 RepID=UPI001650F860|nr:transporter [Hymenobacter sp. BT188]MBC6606225.1 transporter [Hymenobacter sp. BT188]
MTKLYWLLLALLPLAAAQAQDPEKGTKMDGYSLFRPVPRDSMRELHPDRPGITESPFTIDPGHFQVEGDFLRLLTGRIEGERHRTWRVAPLVLKVGLTDQTDFQVALESYTIEKEWPQNEPQQRHSGFGDVTLRLKRNLIGDDDETRVAMAVTGFVRLPTGGSEGVGGSEMGIVVPINYHLAENWELTTQLEGDRAYDREDKQHYFQFVPGITTEHTFTDALGVYGEVVGRWNARKNEWQATFNLGPEIKVGENIQFDMGALLPLTSNTEREFFVGITVRI